MKDKTKEVINHTKRWIEQETVWDEALYATETREKDRETRQAHQNLDQKHSSLASRPMSLKQAVPAPAPRAPRPADPAKATALKALYERYKDCTRCPLGNTRIKFVFGVGNPDSEVLFIGEGPGYEEDRRGEPFVGKAGQLLDKMLAAIGMSRQTNAYIANIVKCHPMANPQTPEARGNDRAPNPEEVETCAPILLQQIKIMNPRVIVTLGSPSTKMILKTKDGITGLRGKYFPFPVEGHYPHEAPRALEAASLFGEDEKMQDERATESPVHLSDAERTELAKIQVLPTYHPAALLRNPNLKPESWADLKLLRETLNRP